MGLKNEGKKPAQPQWFNVILRLKTATDLNHPWQDNTGIGQSNNDTHRFYS